MTLFSNIKGDFYNLSFELNNNNTIKLSVANALRRIMIAEIPTYSIDPDSIDFEINSSMLHSSFLSKRLQLIPINYSTINKYDIQNINISLDKKNNTDHMINITSDDFIIKNNESIIDDILAYKNILFGKLKPNQEIKFTCKFKKGNSKLNGAYFSPVSQSVLTYKLDDKLIDSLSKKINNNEEKNYFLESQVQKYYLKTSSGEPAVYIIDVESIGTIDVKNIVMLGLTVLKDKLVILLDAVKENIENKIIVTLSDKLFTSYNFLIFDEDSTLGYLIDSYLQDFAEIDYAGYVIVHPSDNKLLITTSLKTNNTIENNKKIFINVLNKVIEIFDKLIKEWVTANSIKSVTKKIKIKRN